MADELDPDLAPFLVDAGNAPYHSSRKLSPGSRRRVMSLPILSQLLSSMRIRGPPRARLRSCSGLHSKASGRLLLRALLQTCLVALGDEAIELDVEDPLRRETLADALG